ncbi:FTR1 family protein [Candidatus Micrarchaeota archaeon]|nr:FTR1 family protein [Candidatus Micrarchaeota archaeon]
MFSTFLIVFRESLEAFLIIGILFAYLDKTNRKQLENALYVGAVLGVIASIVTAIAFNALSINFESFEQVFEGSIMLLAAVMIAYVIFWMNKADFKQKLEAKAQQNTTFLGLASIAFFSVYREGIETALFLQASIYQTGDASLTSALLGIIIAAGICYALFKTSSKLKLSTLFKVTSVFLALFSAGLFSHAIHEFSEVGLLPETPIVWNTNAILSEDSTIGLFAKSVFGYNANPSVLELVSYILFLLAIIQLIKMKKK